ncbi:hypothetical protein MMON_42230 [Mycolicibacterium monacense]|uniref:Uncharacterized protein n=2 Tax=Mycolicibacterium monacense TaxID=85693 RepID=A0AAD1J4V6_MYCMB|nr:hypothetical protein MMON_42230 [Mycolicibacterium monacense]
MCRLSDHRDEDVQWSVDDEFGRQVAVVVSTSLPNEPSGTLHFQMSEPGGTPMLSITRFAERQHRLEIRDSAGGVIGQIRQTSTRGQAFRKARMAVVLESRRQPLACADLTIDPSQNRYANLETPIRGAAGAVIATIERQGGYTGRGDDPFVYELRCAQPTGEPLPMLLLVTAFMHSLYDGVVDRGPFGAVGRWLSRPTWES